MMTFLVRRQINVRPTKDELTDRQVKLLDRDPYGVLRYHSPWVGGIIYFDDEQKSQ